MAYIDLAILRELQRERDSAVEALDRAIRALYESGEYSSVELGQVLGCTDAAIRMRARRKGWTRDHHRDHQRH